MMIKVELYSDDSVLLIQHLAPFTQGILWKSNEPILENKIVCWGYELTPEFVTLEDEEIGRNVSIVE